MAEPGPAVLFVCVSNAGKSVMAEGLMRKFADQSIRVRSAGTHAKSAVNELSVQALAEVGIDISAHRPTQVTEAVLDDADLIVMVGTAAKLETQIKSASVRTWATDEPSLRGVDGIERMRLIRDDIAQRVRGLLAEFGVPVSR
ncbi:arsenate-mycothiol transferase ArsC [Mycolicibacterium sp. XJ870]